MWSLQAENFSGISLAHRQRILPLDFLLCFSILEVYSVWQPLCTYMAPRHSDFGTSEIHIPYLSFRHPGGAGLSGESGKGKHFEGRLKTGLGKTSLTRQLLIIHDANNFSLLAKTRDPLCSFPYHHHLDIRNSANQFLGFLEKSEKKKEKKRKKEVGIQVDCALFKVLDQLWPSPGSALSQWNGISQYTTVILAPVSLQQL